MHISGHTLDLILNECISQVSIKNVEQGQFLSDHLNVVAHLSVDKPPLKKKECNFRKINKIDLDDMSHCLEEAFESFENDDLDLMVSEYERILSSVLNELAPMKEKTITLRPTNPWFMEDIKQQKCLMRNQEWAWRKYKLPSNWRAFQIERNKYKSMLRSVWKTTLSKKIEECSNDTKKLYSLVNGLMGRTSENPMLKGESDDQLVENFVGFFMEKIKKIRDSLHDYDVYKPCFSESNKFSEFVPLSEQEVAAIIGKMASKSCEIDPIPTTLLKKVLPSVIGPITAIVNCSITQGIFAQHWKMAII